MKPRMLIISFLSIALVFAPPLLAAAPATQPATQPVFDKQLVSSANQFAINYYKNLGTENDNVVVAPYGVFTFLSILREGADTKGAASLGKALGVNASTQYARNHLHELTQLITTRDSASPAVCNITTQLWLDKSAAPGNDFITALRDGYDADVVYADFSGNPAAAQWSVGKWIHDQSQGMLELDVAQPWALCKAAMVNMIYFCQPWAEPFREGDTKDADFHVTATATVKVPMMNMQAMVRSVHADGMQLIALPYGNDDFTAVGAHYEFIAILPDDPAAFTKLQKNLDPLQLARWIAASVITEEQLDKWGSAKPAEQDDASIKKWFEQIPWRPTALSMPRFDIAYKQDVRGTLARMPGGDPLKITMSKGGTGIDPISQWQIMQGARIQVNEVGTRAAAATVGGLFAGPPNPILTITLDHPFLYLTRDAQTGTIIFLGRLCDPSVPGASHP